MISPGEINRVFEEFVASIRNVFRRRYVGSLEEEVTRLRAENRALLNSLLGTAGVAPLDLEVPRGPMAPTVRRRSWPQIANAREVAETQRAESVRRAASASSRS
jgi:hypothetical protein